MYRHRAEERSRGGWRDRPSEPWGEEDRKRERVVMGMVFAPADMRPTQRAEAERIIQGYADGKIGPEDAAFMLHMTNTRPSWHKGDVLTTDECALLIFANNFAIEGITK